MEVISKTGRTPQAALTLRVDGRDQDTSAEGDGPVDAIFKAIEKIAHSNSHLQLYSVNAVTEGTEAQGEVTVRLEKNGRIVNGQGADTDVLAASAKAYLNALNLLTANSGRLHPQLEGV
jgi:2-isopropylmalate synthase